MGGVRSTEPVRPESRPAPRRSAGDRLGAAVEEARAQAYLLAMSGAVAGASLGALLGAVAGVWGAARRGPIVDAAIVALFGLVILMLAGAFYGTVAGALVGSVTGAVSGAYRGSTRSDCKHPDRELS